jgi:hypothetical protein
VKTSIGIVTSLLIGAAFVSCNHFGGNHHDQVSVIEKNGKVFSCTESLPAGRFQPEIARNGVLGVSTNPAMGTEQKVLCLPIKEKEKKLELLQSKLISEKETTNYVMKSFYSLPPEIRDGVEKRFALRPRN